VATDSSDRAHDIPLPIINDTEIKGRDFLGIMRALLGAQTTDTNDKPGFKMSGTAINGVTVSCQLFSMELSAKIAAAWAPPHTLLRA
jgi:hypothetical protein